MVKFFLKNHINKPLLFLTDTTAMYPVMKANRTEVVVKEGSNVTLTCHGSNVQSHDTTVLWKFNGLEVQGNTNNEFLDDAKKRGNFALYIKNVSREDVGNYTCLAKVSAGRGKSHIDEDCVKLSLDKKGEFHLLLLLLYNIPFNRSTTQQVTLSLGQCCQPFCVFPTTSRLLIKYNEIKFFSEKINIIKRKRAVF